MAQSNIIGAEALIPNSALSALAFLVGEWRTTGTHPLMPGKTLHGRASFAWHEGGAFLVMHTDVDDPQIPSGVALIASDDNAGAFAMSYFDQRGVSRLFQVKIGENTVSWHRDDPSLAQSVTINADGPDKLISKGRMSQNQGPWGDDLSQIYERVR